MNKHMSFIDVAIATIEKNGDDVFFSHIDTVKLIATLRVLLRSLDDKARKKLLEFILDDWCQTCLERPAGCMCNSRYDD